MLVGEQMIYDIYFGVFFLYIVFVEMYFYIFSS